MTSPEPDGDCRVCGYPSWLSDGEGPAHPCCVAWEAEHPGAADCPACRASRARGSRRFRPTVVDDRAVASGKRRSSPSQYRAARDRLGK